MNGKITLGLVLAALFALTACSNTVGDWIECTMACEHYDDCVGDSADSTACIDACETNADNSSAFADRVRTCDECLDDAACSPDCNDECDGIIPAF